ncbi:MAG TPA: hypothetical protein VGJ00_02865 [Rhabdochlamydiaceae bacterium]|jgi:hypothetical protein
MKKAHLPLTHALGWIVGSMLVVNGVGYSCFKMYLRHHHAPKVDKYVRSIIQTGPQKQILKTEYLAEILGLSADAPQHVSILNLPKLKEKLLSSPLISHAELKIIKPNSLYIDYTVRQPIAFLGDFENVAIDREGYPFPFAPFFTPKNLPEIVLGLSSFNTHPEDPDKPQAAWGKSLKGKYLDIALQILFYASDPSVSDYFNVTCIDVSRAFSQSCGTREIVVTTRDTFYTANISCAAQRLLRLSTKHFAQELGNYLKLREPLLEEDRKALSAAPSQPLPERIIDLRIPNLAFVDIK